MLSWRKLSPHTGAEILGVDLSKPVPQETIQEIYRVFLDHCMIIFRDQKLTQEDLVRATGQFGKCADYDRPADLRQRPLLHV